MGLEAPQMGEELSLTFSITTKRPLGASEQPTVYVRHLGLSHCSAFFSILSPLGRDTPMDRPTATSRSTSLEASSRDLLSPVDRGSSWRMLPPRLTHTHRRPCTSAHTLTQSLTHAHLHTHSHTYTHTCIWRACCHQNSLPHRSWQNSGLPLI